MIFRTLGDRLEPDIVIEPDERRRCCILPARCVFAENAALIPRALIPRALIPCALIPRALILWP